MGTLFDIIACKGVIIETVHVKKLEKMPINKQQNLPTIFIRKVDKEEIAKPNKNLSRKEIEKAKNFVAG